MTLRFFLLEVLGSLTAMGIGVVFWYLLHRGRRRGRRVDQQ